MNTRQWAQRELLPLREVTTVDSVVNAVQVSLLLNGSQKTNTIIESDWRTEQKKHHYSSSQSTNP